jgi:acetyltransferase-like isoleucine patch superfamily enzyme
MKKPRLGKGVIIGENVRFGEDVVVWNYVVIGDNTKLGDNTRVGSFCDIGRDVTIGANCIIQAHVTISNGCVIGNEVFIGPNTSVLNDKYPYCERLTPSIVRDNAVIGGCVTILPNVTIGENSVVAAGSVVTKDVPPGAVVKGIPARIMMTREEYDKRKKEFVKRKTIR